MVTPIRLIGSDFLMTQGDIVQPKIYDMQPKHSQV